MILLFDLDNTLADFDGEFDRRWRQFGVGDPVPVERRTNHNYRVDYPQEHWHLIDALMEQKGFFLSLQPLPGALEAVRELAAEGHEIKICTTPVLNYAHCLTEKAAWIDQHLGRDYVKQLILTHDKTVVRGHVLFDDRPDIHGACEPEWRQVLVDHAYNRHRRDLPRIFDWSDRPAWRQALHAAAQAQMELVPGG